MRLRHKFAILLAVAFLLCFSVMSSKHRRTPIRDLAQSGPSGFNYQSLKELIQDNQAATVDEVLPKLPVDCRSQFALVRNSRSLQYGDDVNPRVILRCDSSKLLLAYSSDATQAGYNTLEAIQFDDQTNTFGFKEITFNGEGKPPSLNESPTSCIQCHRTSLRPNWDTYNLWPGVYGGELDGSPIMVGSQEDKAFRSFLQAHNGKQDRFSSLVGLMKLAEIDNNVSNDGNPKNPPEYHPVPSVTDLNSSISKLNFLKVMSEMKSLPEYQKYKFAALAAISGCPDIESFIPSVVRQENSRINFGSIDTNTRNSYRAYVIGKFKRQGNFSRGPTEHPIPPLSAAAPSYDSGKQGLNGYAVQFADPIASLRYVMALQKKDIESWFIARDEGSYSFDDGGYSEQQLSGLIAEDVIAKNPEFQSLFQLKSDPDLLIKYLQGSNKMACEKLKQASLVALSGAGEIASDNSPSFENESVPSPSLTIPKAINTCIQCHAMKIDEIPSIPFDNPKTLRTSLSSGNYPHGDLLDEINYRLNTPGPDHMPQGKYLDSASKAELQQYFKTLAGY